jgi:hypothetical protein
MLEALSCIFSVKPGTEASPTALLGELPDAVLGLDLPPVAKGETAIRNLGGLLVILVPDAAGNVVGFVLDQVPPATQLQRIAKQFARLVESGGVRDTRFPDRLGAARLLIGYLANAGSRLPAKRVLSLACDALTNSGIARNAALVVCRPGQQLALTLSSMELDPARDAIADLMHRWRGDKPVSRAVAAQAVEREDLLSEDTTLLLDKVGCRTGFVSLPPANAGGIGFFLFDPTASEPERDCNDLREVIELRHRTKRDWSSRRRWFRYGWIAAAAAFLIFLLMPTERSITASGVTRPQAVQVVSMHFGTYLDQMLVEVGQTLEPGAAIAILTAPDQEDARSSAVLQRSIEEAAANAALAEDNYGAYVQAQSRVALQEARLQQVEARMALLSPVTETGGRVVAALSGGDRGRYLPAGTEIARVQTGQHFLFEMNLSPSDAGLVSVGQSGQLSLRGQLDQAHSIRILTPPAPDPDAPADTDPAGLVVTALIEAEHEADIVPGLSGIARVDTGRSIRLLVWSRHVLEFVRMKAWTILNWRI